VRYPTATLFVILVAFTLLLASCDTVQPIEPTQSLAPTRTRVPTQTPRPTEVSAAAKPPTSTQMLAPAKLPPSTPAQQEYTYTSQVLTTSYSGALNAANQLILGMLRLAGTANAITSEQAKTLLPMLQSLQGQTLKSDAERNAVFANIEAQLTSAQSSAIANMHLTQDDLQSWMRDNGQGAGFGPGPGGAGPQGTPGAPPGFGGTPPAFGGTPPALRGTPLAPGGTPPAPGGRAGPGQGDILLNALIRLLAQLAT
jgi:hypothetical protein